jgi:hypothetical protein
VVLCGLSSRQTAAACGVTWILAVNIFHFFPSTKIPIPNRLCDSLSCEKGKEKNSGDINPGKIEAVNQQ